MKTCRGRKNLTGSNLEKYIKNGCDHIQVSGHGIIQGLSAHISLCLLNPRTNQVVWITTKGIFSRNVFDCSTFFLSRYREKMKELVERMKYQIKRRDECRQSITQKVSNIKAMHSAITELEPKVREMYTRMRKAEVQVCEFEEKINRKEGEIR